MLEPIPARLTDGAGVSNALTGVSPGKPKRQCCCSAIDPEAYHRVNIFFTSLDKALAEIENRFSGNDQDVLFALGDVTSDSFDLLAGYYNLDKELAGYYNLDKELLQAVQRLFNRFKKAHV